MVDKESLSLLAIFLMVVCNVMIIYANKRPPGVLRFLLKTIAFIVLIVVLFMILIVLFA